MEENRETKGKRRPGHFTLELPEKFSWKRFLIFVLCLAVGVGALGYGVNALISRPAGWREIKVSSGAAENCGADLTFRYRLGARSKQTERELTALYTALTERCQALFSADVAVSGVGNVASVNAHPNETVTVEPELYAAFAQAEECGGRWLYLAPVYACYEGLFRAFNEQEALEYDPFRNAEIADYIAQLLPFVNDPEAVELELLGDGRVCLHVSDGYLRFARENEIGAFVDFYWMKNAFVLDLIASELTEKGYSDGILFSVDGFVRRLEAGGDSFSSDFAVRANGGLSQAATLQYTCELSGVMLRDYPLSDDLGDYYYVTDGGEVRTAFIDPADGRCKAAAHELFCFSATKGCAQVVLSAAPVYIAEALDQDALEVLAREEVYALCLRDGAVYATGLPEGAELE